MLFKRSLLALGAVGAGFVAARQMWDKGEPFSFHNTVVLITGGSRGLGIVLARQLAAEGARLAIIARDEAELERARAELAERGAEVLAFPCDVSDRAQAAQAVERTVAHYGRIDLLINNAGIIQAGPIENMQLEDFEATLNTHLWGPLVTMKAAVPHMRAQGGGRIVNIASIGGKVAVPHLVPYTTSKFALVGLSDGMRAELAKDKIVVTTVCPGLMRTGSHVNALFKGQHGKEFTWFSIIDSLPFTSISAEESARQIIEACRAGQNELVISLQGKFATKASALLPGATAQVMKLMNALLPKADKSAAGNQTKTGWQSGSPVVPSILTELNDEATVRNNGLKLAEQ